MSNQRRQQQEKISADCPHCGYSQLESAYAKSTICRKCGQYFSIEKLLAKEVASLKAPSMFERLSKFISRETNREIKCFSCGAAQVVPSVAESSSCPKCGSYIDLRDFRISGPFGRTVQTQGKVTILKNGDVTTRIMCGAGRIEGKLRGSMVCTGTLELATDGRLPGQVEAHKLVVEKGANIELQKPMKVGTIEVHGTLTVSELRSEELVTVNKRGVLKGAIYAPKVAVEKGGTLEGAVYAQSVAVDQGGILAAELHIGPPEPEPIPEPEEPVPAEPPPQAEQLPPKAPVAPRASVLRKARKVGKAGRNS